MGKSGILRKRYLTVVSARHLNEVKSCFAWRVGTYRRHAPVVVVVVVVVCSQQPHNTYMSTILPCSPQGVNAISPNSRHLHKSEVSRRKTLLELTPRFKSRAGKVGYTETSTNIIMQHHASYRKISRIITKAHLSTNHTQKQIKIPGISSIVILLHAISQGRRERAQQ